MNPLAAALMSAMVHGYTPNSVMHAKRMSGLISSSGTRDNWPNATHAKAMAFMAQQGTLIAAAMKQPYVQPAQGVMAFANVTRHPSAMCHLRRLPQAATRNGNMSSSQFSCAATPSSHVSPYVNQPYAAAAQQQHTRPLPKAEQTLMGSKGTLRASQNALSSHPPVGVEIAKR
ncbi:hypothetical protein AAVH_13007 [Aphelenchoides avenae]|nr:hypothetical protein AAVH_13007 [Aphelenchus avenae]